jgi:signal transduction histidine kinase
VRKINLPFGPAAAMRRRAARAAEAGYLAALQPPVTLSAVRGALRQVLGDPDLDVFVWLADRQQYLDDAGASPAEASQPSRRRHDVGDGRGGRLATLLTDAAARPGADVVDAAIRAATTDLEHARWHTELLARLRDVESGRIRDAAAPRAGRGAFGFERDDSVHRRTLELAAIIGATRPAADPAVRAVTAQAETQLRHVLRDLCDRALVARASTAEQVALGAAVQRLAAVIPFPVQVSVDVAALPPDTASMVYAMVCEALANAVGHAGARRATVTVRRHGPTVQIAVADDGDGGAHPVIGGGIVALTAHAALRGGVLHVDSPPGSGTCFTAELPYDA